MATVRPIADLGKMSQVDVYINFVLHAIYGRMAEADQIMGMAGDAVRDVADELFQRRPFMPQPIYRGMLLDPALPLERDPRLTFVSWSESIDVARWFAATQSAISKPLVQSNPKLRSHIITPVEPNMRVLFHYSWAHAFVGVGFETFALMHPLMGREGFRQVGWSLRTQQEVITDPIDELSVQSVNVDDIELAALDQKLTPPWIEA